MHVNLKNFDPKDGMDRGVSKWFEAAWYICKYGFFLTAIPWPSALKAKVLRAFGAKVGVGVVIKPRVNIHMPWRLTLGDHVWIGEEVFILNMAQVTIGSHVCISQRAFLCTGNHDYRDPTFRYRNSPITIANGAWVGAQVFVGPGIDIGQDAVVSAGSIATKSLLPAMVYSGNPCVPVKPRWTSVN